MKLEMALYVSRLLGGTDADLRRVKPHFSPSVLSFLQNTVNGDFAFSSKSGVSWARHEEQVTLSA